MTEDNDGKRFLSNRKKAYQRTFNQECIDAKAVLADLAKFCRAQETTFDADPRIHALLEGRKEVWLRIQHHLNLTDEQLWSYYTRKVI